jgi:transcriptional regulator with XRE-family HTH domain
MATRYKRAKLGALAADPHSPQLYAAAPGLKEAREAAGVTLEGLAELTGYPADFLQRMENEGQTAPRVVTSRISAVLGVEHVAVRGEGPQEVTRLRDIQERN